MTRRILALTILSTLLLAPLAEAASWYDDYDAGLAAVRRGDWNVVIQKMTSAIKGNAKENNRARTYGTIMINYHPYYYRGVAYMQTGRYEEAVADLERTSGPGPENLGSIDTLMERAKKQLATASEPEPEPVQVPTRPEPRPAPPVSTAPPVTIPTAPQIDAALRQRASAALGTAKQRLQAAQQRRASNSPQYAQAMAIFTDASTRNASARSNDDLRTVVTMAGNAGDLADLAMAPTVATTTQAPPPIVTPRPSAATTTIMQEADYSADVRTALENYFAGEFEEAARQFEALTLKMPRNGWLHAFLGASQYSLYAFEADERYRDAAVKSFQKARELRNWKDGLPSRYFSKKIRKAFDETKG